MHGAPGFSWTFNDRHALLLQHHRQQAPTTLHSNLTSIYSVIHNAQRLGTRQLVSWSCPTFPVFHSCSLVQLRLESIVYHRLLSLSCVNIFRALKTKPKINQQPITGDNEWIQCVSVKKAFCSLLLKIGQCKTINKCCFFFLFNLHCFPYLPQIGSAEKLP